MNNIPLQLTKIVLLATVAVLAYYLVESIVEPIQYDNESRRRYVVVEKKMEKIRDAQYAFKEVTGKYANSFDTLEIVMRKDSLKIDKQTIIDRADYDKLVHGPEPKIYDDTTKYIISVITNVAIMDSMFTRSEYPLEELRYIPFSSEKKEFYLSSGYVEAAGGRFKIPVFEVTAPFKFLLEGLPEKYFEVDHGYRLGSLYEANTEITRAREPVYHPDLE